MREVRNNELRDINKERPEGKLRISWEVRNDYVGGGALMFTSTWNLDNFTNDFWDGGNVTYQRTF